MMVLVRAPFPIVVCALLAGCGGGASPEAEKAQEQPAPAAEAPDKRPVIVAFGNSLTAGYGVDPGKSYPDFLQQMLDKEGYRYRVVNAGISGDTTSGGVERVDSVIAMKPDIVILELGPNDGLRGLPPSSTRANLDEIITRLKEAGAQVMLAGMTLPRNYGPDYIRSFDNIFPDLAKKHDLSLIPFFLAGVAENNAHMQADRLHPTVEGNRIVASNVMKILQSLLKRASE
jgi:acyl-CoA thioesterase-1